MSNQASLPVFNFKGLLSQVVPGFDGEKWKVVRHLDRRQNAPDLLELYYNDRSALEVYQADQSKDVFRECLGIFSFVGLPGRRALFIGAYQLLGKAQIQSRPSEAVPLALKPLYQADELANPGRSMFTYSLELDKRFSALEMRVVVDWGAGALAWHQWDLNKAVTEIRDANSRGPCPEYDRFDVSLSTLAYVIQHSDANPSWRERLSAVGGIYLLTCRLSNRLYVGQAGGEGGFWGRWRAYAERRTGNVAIDPAFATDELRMETTDIAILEPIPRTGSSKALLDEKESRWKRRLCTRETGFNKN